MKYSLINSTINDLDFVVDCKCSNIFEYALDLNCYEMNKIRSYVISEIRKELNNFKLIECNEKVIGIVSVYNYQDGVMIDEIFIEEMYRNNGIGTDIIKKILKNNSKVYLWVYKDNVGAVKLYKKLQFVIKEENKDKYLMECVE